MTTNTPANTSVAFLGIGQMGAPMATRLIGAGFNVHLWNRTPERLEPLIALGGVGEPSPSDAASGADFIVTMLPDGSTVRDVMSETDGAFTTLKSGATWLQMSSVGVAWTNTLMALANEHGVVFIDAPVSGSIVPARDGKLIVLASGPDGSREVVAPLFDVLGHLTVWLGDAGAGSKAKLVLNNWLVDLVESTVETLRFAEALGLDPTDIIDLLDDAPIGSPYAVSKARLMLQGDFTANFALKLAFKDAKLSLDAARDVGVDLGITEGLIDSWQHAVDNGLGDEDLSVIFADHPRRRNSPT